ncbi:MAG: Spy/CpxP family protein refolding chaperone [Cyclobacteriaceae bacterium]
MTSKKIYQIGFVALILINATLIFLLAQHRPPRRPMHSEAAQNTIVEKISSTLALTEDQKTDYQSMASQHGEQMRVLDGNHRVLIKAYFETLNDNAASSADSIRNEILQLESEKLQYTYDHFEELKSILSEQQKGQFDLIIKDILAVLIGRENKLPPPPRNPRD